METLFVRCSNVHNVKLQGQKVCRTCRSKIVLSVVFVIKYFNKKKLKKKKTVYFSRDLEADRNLHPASALVNKTKPHLVIKYLVISQKN